MPVIQVRCVQCSYEFFTRELKSSTKQDVEIKCNSKTCSGNCVIIRT